MAYVLPQNVTSPRDRWEFLDVLYDGGPQRPAIAFGRWDESEIIAIRWNGDDQEGSAVGNPQSRGLATWFVLPDWLALATLHALLAQHVAGDKHVVKSALDQAFAHFKKDL